MKKLSLTFLCAIAVSPLLMQCASQDELNQIHYQLRMLNKKVSDLESTTIDDMQKRQASNASQIDRLHSDFLELQSSLEETGHLNRRLKEQSKELETAFRSYTRQEEEKRQAEMQRLEQEITEKDRRLELLAQQLDAQQENLQAIQQARVAEAKRKAAQAAAAAEAARRKAAARPASQGSSITRIRAEEKKKVYSTAGAPPPSPASTSSNETETASAPAASASTASTPPAASAGASLSKAKSLFDQGKYRQAYQEFERISQQADTKTADSIEARFLMGESLYALQEYDQAILDYQDIITNHPSSAKAPAAMLRQAMAFESLDDKDTAKILYKKLVSSYKGSPEAAQAQKKLNTP